MMPTSARMMIAGGEVLRGVGEQRQAQAQHPEGADLVQHADQQHRGARRGLSGRVGQPRVQRPHRGLDREGDEEPEEQPLLQVGADVHADQGGVVERARTVLVDRQDVEPDQRGEHEQAAEQRVQEELDGRVLPLGAAVAPDEEVHRDQHRLEQHVEQEDVGGGEHADDQALEDQDPGEVPAHRARRLVGVRPAGQRCTTGTRMTVMRIRTRAMPSTPRAKLHAPGRDPLPGADAAGTARQRRPRRPGRRPRRGPAPAARRPAPPSWPAPGLPLGSTATSSPPRIGSAMSATR